MKGNTKEFTPTSDYHPATKKYVDDGGGGGTDAAAIHDDTPSEISAITEKTSPVAADMLLIEDSADTNATKMLQITNLPGGAPADNSVTNAKLADMALDTIKGNDAALGDPKDLTASEVRALIDSGDITGVVLVSGDWQVNPDGSGGLTAYDLSVGDTDGTPTYGVIRIGNAIISRTSYISGNLDLDGAILIRNVGGAETGQIEYVFADSSNVVRFAIPVGGVGNATYNPRSMLIAGPAPSDSDMVTVGYWQTNNSIFDNLVCDTSGSGADLGVQNDLEVEGDIFIDSIKESTTDTGVTIDGLLVKDSGIPEAAVTAHEGAITHQNVSGAGTNTHAQIDTHIASTADPHSVAADIVHSKSITIEDPASGEDISMFFTNSALTITEIRAVVRGSTPSVTWTIRHGTDRSAAGAEAVTDGTATTSESAGSDVTAFDDATVVADSFVWLETTAQTGTVDELNLTVIYTYD